MALIKGSEGLEVRKLQEDLKVLGFYPHHIDGSFGSKTREAVLAFQERYFVDGLADAHTLKSVEQAVIAWAKRERTILLNIPKSRAEITEQFGLIEYKDVEGGYVRITNDWIERNIERVVLPIVGKQAVHRLMVPVFTAVLEELRTRGLDKEIYQFGCWCPRYKMHNPRKSLSTHSWAIACDINQSTNMPGTRGDLHPGIVDVFERYGFEWGGRWERVKDPMHFEYTDIG